MRTHFNYALVFSAMISGSALGGCSSDPAPADGGARDVADVPVVDGADATPDQSPADVPGDTAADAPADVARDTAADAPADVASDTAADAPADTASDIAADAPADVVNDTAPADAPASDGGLAAACTASGGTVTMTLCCTSASDFPNQCLTGACGCSPTSSRMVMTCQCAGATQCFDGTTCRAR